MALVPFRTSGAAADQRAEERLFQVAGLTLRIRQLPGRSGSLRPGAAPAAAAPDPHLQQGRADEPRPPPPLESLAGVGFVVWQSGFVLADLLVRQRPLGEWVGLGVVDLGTGTGLVGIALALAGAHVRLTDLPHVLPLTAINAEANCGGGAAAARVQVLPYAWGEPASALALPPPPPPLGPGGGGGTVPLPDVITAADVLYHEDLFGPLMAAIGQLSAPHTVTYVAYKARLAGRGELAFVDVADAAGFAAEAVPLAELHEEYRDGQYGVLRLARRDAAGAGAAAAVAIANGSGGT